MPGLAGEVANLIVALKLDDSGFSGKLNSIAGRLKAMDSGLSQMGRGIGQVGSGLSRIGTVAAAAAAGGLTAIVKTAIDFEAAFAAVRKTVEATPAELDELSESFREMSRETGIAYEEFSRIGEIAGALGIGVQSIDEFALAVSKASSATGLSVDSLADSVGRIGTILDLDESTYETFLSTIVELGNKGASTEAEILEITKRFAGTGVQAELTTDQIVGLSSAIAGLGVAPEAAGSALSRIMSNFITEVANGTDKAKAFAEVAGVSFKDFAKTVEDDTLGAVLQFVKALDGLDKLEKFRLLKEAGITNVRDRDAILKFAGGIDKVTEALGYANKEWGKTNALNTEFAKRQEAVDKQLAIVRENIRDVANTIGKELLPIIAQASKDFVEFINLDTTQAGIKDFAEDLRGFFTELKGADFSGLLDTLKVSADVAKTALNIFNALPGPLKGALIAGVALNKATFGGVGLLLRGIGNIGVGGVKTAFGLRGSTPGTPVFTKEVGLGGVAGGAGGLAGGGKGFWAGAGKVFGIAAAGFLGVEIGKEIGQALIAPTVTPAVKFEESQFQQFLEGSNTENIAVLRHNLEAVESGIHDIAGNTVDGLERFLIPQIGILEGQRDQLRELLTVAEAQRDAAFDQNRTEEDLLNEAKQSRLAQAHNTAAIEKLTLEQRLLRDKEFKAEVNAEQFIRILRRTSEFGAKGEGTTIERGPRTGRDPFGRSFVALVQRLEKPALESVVVQGEISRHIQAAEEVQVRALKEGDRDAAVKLQKTIDTLHRILGTEDKHRAVDERGHRDTKAAITGSGRDVANRVNEASRAIGASRQAVLDMGGRQVSYLASINSKDFSPHVTVNADTTVNVLSAAGLLIQQTRIEQAISGTGVGGPVAPGTM